VVQTADVLSKFPDIGAGQLKASARGGLICALVSFLDWLSGCTFFP